MMRRILTATHLVMLVQARGFFPHAFGLYVVIVIALLRFVVPQDVTDFVLPAFLVTEPGMLGVMAVAAHRYLELGNSSVSALHVSPLGSGEYLLALLIGSAVLGTLGGVVTFAAVVGLDERLIWLAPALFVFAVLSGLVGFAVSLRYPDFPRFILGSIPVIAVWQAPLFAVYHLVPTAAVAWIPSAPGIFALAAVCSGEAGSASMLACSLAAAGITAIGFAWVARLYGRRLRAGLEVA